MPAKLTKDSYKVIYGKDFSYRRNQIFKVDRIWKYVGVLHEYATSENNKNNTVATIEGDYYIDSRRLGDRNKDKNKYKKDIEILLRGAEDEPDNERYIFYLAQSYMDDGQLENSNKYYLQRFNMGGWVEEQYYSLLKIGINNIKLRKNKKVIIDSLLEAFNFRPSRLEALYELVNYLFYNERDKDVKSAAKYAKLGLHIYSTTDTLFVTKSIYEYKFLDLAYLAFFYNNEFGEAYKSINNLLNRQKYPENQNIRLQKNRGFAIPKIMDNIIKYPKEKIQFLTENIKNKLEIKVLFTITTCKRLDLFINTIHSFINCCEDIDLIDKFICIDDNSSIRERKEMKQKYPFFDFIFKPSREKGHINSMNKILDCITIYNPKYILHLEDDWNFYAKKCYITDSIKIIENTKNIKQVLFNKNYAELYDEKSLNLVGGIRKHIDGLFYIEHEHYKENTRELKDFYDRNKGSSSSAYWPHFSFRPSLICCDIFKKIGRYRSDNGHFEMDYANRFVNSGYKSAFFYSLSCYHTGKLTSENNSDKPNAYKLNNVVQFTAKQSNSNSNYKSTNNLPNFNKVINEKKKNLLNTKLHNSIQNNVNKYNLVFTITTCKRVDLFIETMNNFIYFCKDIESIERWYCIDDNSSFKDREIMKKTFPFFEFKLKHISQKGHIKSLNWIWKNVNSKYIFHMEDDWEFSFPFKIIELLNVIIKQKLHQLILIDRIGNHTKLCKLENNLDAVFKYNYNSNHCKKPLLNKKYDQFLSLDNNKNTPISNYWWWPGFSLNPSILNLEWFIKNIGYFNPILKNGLFEYDYALRTNLKKGEIGFIRNKNLKILHTGKLSSYVLNNESRYYEK